MASFAAVHVEQLVTLAGPTGPRTGPAMRQISAIPDGAFLVVNDRFGWIGKTDDLPPFDGPVLDLSGKVVLPGFVDCHTHPVFGGNRIYDFVERSRGKTYAEIAEGGGGILSSVRSTRAATQEEIVEVGRRHARMFLENGTTTIEAKSGYGLDQDTELRMLRAIRSLGSLTPIRFVPTFLGAHAFPPEYRERKEEYIDVVRETALVAVRENLAKSFDIFVEDGYFTADQARALSAEVQELGMTLRMHVDQFSDSGGAGLAAQLGAKSADHLEYTGTEGIKSLAASQTIPVLLPASVYCLGLTRYPNAREMIDAGLPVVLATDFNPGSSPTLSMPFVMSLACTQMRMTPEEALVACTHNAACVLDLGHEVGSIQTGHSADFTIWDCREWREVIYHVGSRRPLSVYVKGTKVI